MVNLQKEVKRKFLNHKAFWTTPPTLDYRELLEELGIRFKRRSVDGHWKYVLFRARKEKRLKVNVLSLLQPTEITEIEAPTPIISELQLSILEQEAIKKRQPLTKIKKIRELNAQGRFEEAQDLYEEAREDLQLEVCTLHIRVDYNKEKAKKGHEFFMDNTFISGEFPKGMSDEEVMELLKEEFTEQFIEEFGFNPFTQTDAIVEGLERGQQLSTGILFNYKHTPTAPLRTIKKEVQTTLW